MKRNKETNKTKRRFKLSLMRILGNNRILMALSVIFAFALWMWVAIEKSPEVQTVITGVPIKIDLKNTIPEQLGLQIFGETNYTVDVTVTGKKYILSSLKADDISVEANVNYVDSPGIKTLQLRVTPKNDNAEYSISAVSATYIEVFFDNYKEIEMPIKADTFSNLASVVEDGCLLGDLVLSQSAVTVSGPATEINRITSVKAVAKIDSVLKKTTTFDPGIELITNDGTQLEYSVVNFGDKNITLTVPVLKIVTLPTVVEFKNAPAYFVSNPLSYTVTPSSVSVAVPVEAIATTNAFVVDTVDFADLTNSLNNFNVSADSINSYKITDSSVKSFKIRIDATKFSSKTVTIPADSVILKNSRDDFDIQIDKSKDITINLIGPEASLEKITAANIAVEIDTADKTIAKDTKTLPAKITVSGVEDCWATGKNEIKITAVSIE